MQGITEAAGILRQGRPVESPVFRIGLAVITEVRGDDAVVEGELPREGVPEPGRKTGGMEENEGRTLSLVEKIGNLHTPDILPAQQNAAVCRIHPLSARLMLNFFS